MTRAQLQYLCLVVPLHVKLINQAQALRLQQSLQHLKVSPCPQIHVNNNPIRKMCPGLKPSGEIHGLHGKAKPHVHEPIDNTLGPRALYGILLSWGLLACNPPEAIASIVDTEPEDVNLTGSHVFSLTEHDRK